MLSPPLASASTTQVSLHVVERVFADFLDAHGAVEAIDAGTIQEVGGKQQRYWVHRRAQLKDKLSLLFNELNDKYDVKSSGVAAAMRRSFEELTASAADTSALTVPCADAPQASASSGRLSASLYACFDSIGNQIRFENIVMTRVAALQLLQELVEPERRQALFIAMAPLWRAVNGGNESDSPYRRLIAAQAPAYSAGRSPIHDAAGAFGIDTAQAERWLLQMLESWQAANQQLGPIEPWDYRYRYSAASRALASRIPRQSLLPLQQRFYVDLGADPATLGVIFDIDPRPGKAPLAYADIVRVGREVNGRWRPAIARVSANDDRGGLGILNELVHETGHAVHYMAIRARPAFFWPDTTFIEAFADVPSWSVYTPEWQQKYLGHSVSRADGLREQYAGVMLDVAWSLFELRLLREPQTDPNQLWTQITQRYLNIAPHAEMSWWAVRSQLVTDPGYMIHYGLGALITAQIRARTTSAIGPFDAGNARWYAWSSNQLLAAGGSLPMHQQLQSFLGHAATPAALIEDIASIASTPH